MSNNAKEKAKDLLLEIYGGKSFCKIYQALSIGKIKFSFAEKGKEKDGIDCYMNADDFVADFIRMIRDKSLLRKAEIERQRAANAGDKYCKDIWKSRAGLNGENMIRAFTIQPGSSTEFVFRATLNGRSVTVGFDYRELLLLEYRWSFLEEDWKAEMRGKYSLKNMRDENREKYNKKQAEEMEKEENSAPAQSPIPESQPAPQPPASDVQEKPKFMVGGSKPESEQGTPQQEQPPLLNLRLKITIPVAEMKNGGKCVKAITEDGVEYAAIFCKELIAQTANWNSFEQKCANAGTIISIKGRIYGNRISVLEVAA